MAELGVLYQLGNGAPADMKKAVDLYQQAADFRKYVWRKQYDSSLSICMVLSWTKI